MFNTREYAEGKSKQTLINSLSIFFFILLFISLIQPAYAADEKDVLFINSYHKGQDWGDEISKGIEDFFAEDPSVTLYTEYMDTKNYPSDENYQNLYNLYTYKYKDRDFNVIITSDDNALKFILEQQDTLFPETPVVFCGVNEVSYDFQKIHQDITGVLEYVHIKDTIQEAIEINPKPLKRIYILTDITETGHSNRLLVDSITPEFGNEIEFVHIYDIGMDELLFEASNMPDDSAILYVVFNRDTNGNVFTNREAVSLLSEKSSVPVYSMIDNIVGYGPVGGIVMSPYQHGYLAAEYADEIMKGKNPSEIKIQQDPYSYPLFDYETLSRFGYDFSKLPEDSIILNEPDTIIEISLIQYIAILLIGLCLFIVTVLLIISNRRIKITGELLRTSEERLSMAMQATKDGIWDWNFEKNEYYASPFGLEMLGYTPGEIVFTPELWETMIHPDDKERILASFNQSKKSPGKFIREYRIKTKSGAWKWIRTRGNVTGVKDGSATRIVGTFTDIGETIMYRDALLEANKKLSILSSVTRHDTLNQVTALLGYLEIMGDLYAEDEDVSAFIQKLTRSAEIIQQQINFAKDYEEMGLSKPEWQDVSTVAKRAATTAMDDKIEIIIDIGNVEIFADLMLEKVFFNLFDNSKRHGKNVTKIRVSFKKERDMTGIITVEDNGRGVEPDKKEEIFKKGYGGNSGYGLFLVENILGITNITIKETGTYGKGARFEIIVPETMWHIPADIKDI
ncbi:MAG: PAS domain-containing protein [Methanomicrobiaceae archaeon]|nr:PAS domain-containing protein [Methanomicrobiaceae archaeon]